MCNSHKINAFEEFEDLVYHVFTSKAILGGGHSLSYPKRDNTLCFYLVSIRSRQT